MLNKNILISIVTYNSKDIFEVLDNLREQFVDSTFLRIAIFDNNSDCQYQQRLQTYSDFADIHLHETNQGFGYGHNFNLLTANEKYFLVLNPDVILTKETVYELHELIDKNEEVGLVVPKVLNTDGTTQYLIRDRLSVFDYALRFIPFRFVKKIFDKRLSKYECRDLPDDKVSTIRIGSGCCMFIRGEAFKAINGFDARYFMYFEDYDFCIELSKKDYQILYSPFSTIIHFYGKEAHKNFKLFKIFMRSMVKFFNKWGWKIF